MAGAGAIPFVNSRINSKKVVLFAKCRVPACNAVRALLNEFDMKPEDFEVAEIESRQDVSQIETYFQIICLTDSREVPQLFVGGKYIGGEKEVTRLHASGELKRILVEAGAV